MKILLIEPDEYYHPHFAQTLGPLGEVLISRDTAAANEHLQQAVPDAIVMELLLPDRSGYEFLEQTRTLRAKTGFPVIVFSRIENLEDIEAALNYGTTGYFVKGKDTVHDIKKLLLSLTHPRSHDV